MEPAEVIALFGKTFGTTPRLLTRAPGRVNLLGGHVDYNLGPVLPAALDRAVRLAAAPSGSRNVTLHALDLNQSVSFNLDALQERRDLQGKPLADWALYPAAVAWSLQEAGFEIEGLQAVYTADIPIGAGLSSSAAVEVAFAMTWRALGNLEIDRMQLARLCQRAENEFVGVASGLMDQFASAHGVAGHALYFDTRSLVWEPVPLPAATALVIADSGLRRQLAGSEYNERRAACEQAVEILHQFMPEIESLRDISAMELAAYGEVLPATIRLRAEHVIKEIARVESAVIALRRGEAKAFGSLMFAGHASLRDLYQVSRPELDQLVEIARELPGCFGARLTGAGFGGCTVNLVEEARSAEFTQLLRAEYARRTGLDARVYLCRASAGADVEALPA
jgi:galactokinase